MGDARMKFHDSKFERVAAPDCATAPNHRDCVADAKALTGAICNAMTVDVEDYFHVGAFSGVIDPTTWDHFPSRVERNTYRILDLFDEQDVRITFFVLGWVAERFPKLVRVLAERGHEIACHGYSHQLVYGQTPTVFREETVRAKACLEDQVQRPVLGYRAASYSITKPSLWAIDILAELGFSYDSSIFPIRHDRYGIPHSPQWPYRLTTSAGCSIIEFPPSTVTIFGQRLPVAGGGYFRLYPYRITHAGLAQINRVEGRPFIFYLHPWEIDPDQPRIRAGMLSSFRHYTNLNRCEIRLRRLLQDFDFAPVASVLETLSIPTVGACAAFG